MDNYDQIVAILQQNHMHTNHLLIYDTLEGWSYNGTKNWKTFTANNKDLVNIEFYENNKTFKILNQLDIEQYRIYVLEEFNE